MTMIYFDSSKTVKTPQGLEIVDVNRVDETLWIGAPTKAAVVKFLTRIGRTKESGWALTDLSFKTWEEGLDCILNRDGIIVLRATATLPGIGKGS